MAAEVRPFSPRPATSRRASPREQAGAPALLLLHGAAADGGLQLWGESAPAAGARAGGGGRKGSVAPSPYDCGAAAVRAALRVSGVSFPPIAPSMAVIWLPSYEAAPAASSGLIAREAESASELVLRPWLVNTVALAWPLAIEFLCASAGRRTLAPGLVIGPDLEYWTLALRFAAALVARQHFLPDVVAVGGEFFARWRPVLSHVEAAAMAQLAAAMPDACRALASAEMPPDQPAAVVLAQFVERATDALVRMGEAEQAKIPSSFASADEQWIAALRRPGDGRLAGERATLQRLEEKTKDWWRPVALNAASPFRLCFRLEQPPEDESGMTTAEEAAAGARRRGAISEEGTWHLRYLLQAHHDPSLLVPLSDAWLAKGDAARLLQRDGFQPREYLLQALGQAARLCPIIEASLHGSLPTGARIDTAGAAAFLSEHAAVLEQAGFGVLLPAAWSSQGTKARLGVRAKVKAPAMAGASGLSLAELVEVNWEAALGEQPLSLPELRALARMKTSLVRVRGQWVMFDPHEVRRAIALLQGGARQVTAREALQMAMGAGQSDYAPVDHIALEGWLGELLQRLNQPGHAEPLALPAGLRGTLRPYQERGSAWLGFLTRWGLGACLADDMGLGKTIQALVQVQRERERSPAAAPVLLVCPTSVIGNWQHEVARFTPGLRLLVHHGVARSKAEAFHAEAHANDLVVTSYSLLQRDRDLLSTIAWSGVILDEAQNIKNPDSKQARAARALKAGYRIALTGTPVENHVGDLWSLTEFLNPGWLGTQADFKRRFFVPLRTGADDDAARRLRALTAPFILRRLKTDKSVIADLPEKLEMKVYCTLTREQASLYAAVVEEGMAGVEAASGIGRKGIVLATLSKLKQVCNHPAQFLGDNSSLAGRSGKLSRLSEMLEEVTETGERALIFTQFAEMGALIKRHLESICGREVLFLHGGVPKAQRDRMVERFQSGTPDGPTCFVLSLKAGGTGLNLTAATHVFHFDRWWNPAVENQATDRAFRIGQKKRVQVHKFLCAGTLEEKIDEMIERKQSLAQAVVGGGEEWLTRLSTEELRGLLRLRADAVAE